MRSVSLIVLTLSLTTLRAEIPKPTDAPQPLSPEDSRQQFTIPDGFRIDLIASEPLIADPSCVAWDEHGRLFVTEIHGYNLEGQLDVNELNKTGKLDTAIRRVRVGPEMKAEAQKGQTGHLKLLKDTNGDGVMDEVIVWASDIPAAYGVIAARGGVIVTAAPDILFFADTDGDDQPDVRETLFTGFEVGEMERAINNPVWGVDNWLYAGQGWSGGTVSGPKLKETVTLGRTDFRFRADGSAIEPVSGSNHTFGMAFDDFGHRWLITTSQHAQYALPLPHRYLIRNPHVATPRSTLGASDYHNTFPSSQPHPWRRKRGADSRWVNFYGAGEAKPSGNFTSACGQVIYRADAFPSEYHGNHFCCDPQQNMVHRSIIERDGPGVKVRRPSAQENSEFVSSSDGWFRPNNLRVGPDGALYIIDMYREIIEDYSAIPRYLQQQYGLSNGSNRGRIWRLAPIDLAVSSMPYLAQRASNELETLLSHPNHWWRETAQRLLVERRATIDATPPSPSSFQHRMHVLRTTAALGKLSPKALMLWLDDPHPAVRLQALQLADQHLKEHSSLLNRVFDMAVTETDPNVLLQLAMTIGESDDVRVQGVLRSLAAAHPRLRWIDHAILSSIASTPGPFLREVLKASPKPASTALIDGALQTVARSKDRDGILLIRDLMKSHPDASLRLKMIAVAADHQLAANNELRELADAACSKKHDDEDDQLTALSLLRLASPEVAEKAMRSLLSPNQIPDFQDKAIQAMTGSESPQTTHWLVAQLQQATPRLTAIITRTLLAREASTLALLQSDHVHVSLFSPAQRDRLSKHNHSGIRDAALALFAAPKPTITGKRYAHFQEALVNKHNPKEGAKLFATHCAICHILDGKGKKVGPELDGEAGRPAESLLADVLHPSAEITAGYATYMVETRSKATYVGVLAEESATSVTISQAGGKDQIVLRADLLSITKLDASLMPAVAETMEPQQLASIIHYLKQTSQP